VTNLYADVGSFRRRLANNSTLDASDQAEILRVLAAASRETDDYCQRAFYAESGARYYDGSGAPSLWLPQSREGDLLTVTTLKVDEDGDGVFETTLAANTDYWTWPDNTSPKNRIDLNPNGQLSAFPEGRRRVEITGVAGYTDATEATGDTVQSNPLSSSATTMAVTAGTNFEPGQTILVEAEQIYIGGVSGNNLTPIVRGVNGTSAAAHVQGLAIVRYAYVPEVVEATLIQASRLWKRRETAYANVVQNPLTGTMEQYKGFDPDAMALLASLRLRVVG
jgi:hypothetical protein